MNEVSCRIYNCLSLDQVQGYYLTRQVKQITFSIPLTQDYLHLGKMYPEIHQHIASKGRQKLKWLQKRLDKLKITLELQNKIFQRLGQGILQQGERMEIKDLRQRLGNSEVQGVQVRSEREFKPITKTELLAHKIGIHQRHLKRQEELNGLEGAKSIESQQFEKIKEGILSSQHHKQQQRQRMIAEQLLLPLSIRNKYMRSLKRMKMIDVSLKTRSEVEKQFPLTDRRSNRGHVEEGIAISISGPKNWGLESETRIQGVSLHVSALDSDKLGRRKTNSLKLH